MNHRARGCARCSIARGEKNGGRARGARAEPPILRAAATGSRALPVRKCHRTPNASKSAVSRCQCHLTGGTTGCCMHMSAAGAAALPRLLLLAAAARGSSAGGSAYSCAKGAGLAGGDLVQRQGILPCHSFSHTNLKSPRVGQVSLWRRQSRGASRTQAALRSPSRGESTALSPLPLIFSYKCEKSLCGAATPRAPPRVRTARPCSPASTSSVASPATRTGAGRSTRAATSPPPSTPRPPTAAATRRRGRCCPGATVPPGAHSSKLTVPCSHSFSQSNRVPYGHRCASHDERLDSLVKELNLTEKIGLLSPTKSLGNPW